MNKTFYFLVGFIFLLISAPKAQAQLDQKGALGLRFGSAQGVTYKHTLTRNKALEGILSIQNNSKARTFRLVGLYEFYSPIATNFTWFYGLGGSIGSYRQKDQINNGVRMAYDSKLNLSIDGVVGINYAIPGAPFELALDIKPYLDILNDTKLKIFDPIGFSVRYTF